MKKETLFLGVLALLSLFGCKGNNHIITIKNNLDVARSFETVEVNRTDLELNDNEDFESFSVKDLKTNKILTSQFVDENQDGKVDVLLFQPELDAKATKQFELIIIDSLEKPKTLDYCYSRIVPERTDDYTWENNKVAFRTFGPKAQKMAEDSIKGGTLSSGIDAWLKRVDYPIINKWYKNDLSGKGSYHEDHGEGLDNFHVGVSRGIGGIAAKSDTLYQTSKNFTNWKTITTGPIRTSFVLEYADWQANGKTISETKYISLDYGSNLSRFEIHLSGTDAIHAGLTLHEKDGIPTQNENQGWVSYWQPHGDSELGSGIVVPKPNMASSVLYETPVKDKSHLYTEIKLNNGKAIYYAGFGWKKAGEFNNKEAWENYLNDFALKINNPLEVSFN